MDIALTSITVALPEDRLNKLRETAARLGVIPEDLVRVSIEELLAQPEEDFERAIEHVLEKNSDLYQRLA